MAHQLVFFDDSNPNAVDTIAGMRTDFANFGIDCSTNLNISGIATFRGIIADANENVGSAGSVLSSTGSGINWIPADEGNTASASNVGTNVDATAAEQWVAFVGANSGNNPVRVDDDLRYNPSTNYLSIGGLILGDGNDDNTDNRIRLGASQDLEIFHDAKSGINDGRIVDNVGHLKLETSTDKDIIIKTGATQKTNLKAVATQGVELYFDGTERIKTTDAGVTVTGTVSATAFSGDGSALTGLPSAQIQADWDQATTSALDFIKNKPTIPSAQVQSDWDASSGMGEILNKPTIPAAQIQSDWNQSTDTALDFIKNKPTIPAAQIQSDWNQSTTDALDFIKNKPTIPAAQIQSDWNQSNSGSLDFIKNKPTIPTNTDTTYSVSAEDHDSDASKKHIRLTAGGSGSGTDDVTLVGGTNISLSRSTDEITINATGAASDTTYGISCEDGDETTEEKITLTPSSGSADSIVLAAGTGLSIARVDDKITFTNSDPNTNTTYDYELADHGSSTGSGLGNDAILRLNPSTGDNDDIRLIAGSNVTLTQGTGTITLSSTDNNDNTITNAFTTISVSGQDDVVAETTSDTLELVAGSNVTLTTDADNDKITITASGGASASDSFTTVAVDGQDAILADSSTDTLNINKTGGMTITSNATTDTITFDSRTYTLQCNQTGSPSADNDDPSIALVGSDTNISLIEIVGGSNVTVTRNDADKLTIDSSFTNTDTFLGLTDTPGTFTASKFVKVNAAGNALEFVDDPNTNTTYTLPDTGIDGTNYTDAKGSATITLTGSDTTTDEVVITAGDNIKITGTGSGGFTINAQDTNTQATKADLDVDHLITLSGVAAASDHLGEFTGSTIDDDQTIKAALQALETELETKPDNDTNTTYTLPAGGTDGTNYTDAKGSATITLTGANPSSTDTVTITAGDNIKVTSTGEGGFTLNAQDTTYSNFGGTTAGLVPTSTADDDTKFLRADGTWVVPDNTEYSNFAGTTAGLVPTSTSDDDTKFLRADGTWVVPDNDNTQATKADLDVDHLITLSGVTDASDNLGAFTGSTIADDQTIKAALQALETELETKPDTDNNDYVNSLAFATGTGVLTLGRTGSLADLTVDLDGRYLTSHGLTFSTGITNTGGTVTVDAATTVTAVWTASALTPNTVDTIALSSYSLVEYIIYITHGSSIQSQKLTVMDDGSNVFYNSYGIMYTTSLIATVTAVKDGSNFKVKVTPESGINGAMSAKFIKQVII